MTVDGCQHLNTALWAKLLVSGQKPAENTSARNGPGFALL